MGKITSVNTWRRLQHHYRFVIMNDDTLEEVTAFRISRLRVYMAMSILFIFLLAFTVALLVLTPLKFYIPGYGNAKSKSELQALKLRADSLQQSLKYREVYLDNLKTVLNGSLSKEKDTVSFKENKRR